MAQKLWEKSVQVNKDIERFTVGRDREMDLYLAKHDVLGSMAHITMLESIGLLTKEELSLLLAELKNIYATAESGEFVIEEGVEDVHSQVELMLTRKLGDVGKKIHSGRSRNDQVLLDLKLFTRAEIRDIAEAVEQLFHVLVMQSERYKDVLMPGYTHLQIAMPSSFGLWFGAYAESLVDDMLFLQAAFKMCNRNPLGSAAGYGSSFPLNRTMTTRLLGFDSLNYNVVYAQMGRGKMERNVAFALASIAGTVSKLAFDACMFNSQNFGFVKLPDDCTTGSSIMPHKKNPDVFELTRAKCNKLQSLPQQIMMIANNLPSGYFRDLQIIKEVFLPAFRELKDCLHIHSGVLFANSSNRGRCMKACRWPYKIIDEQTGQEQETTTDGDYRLALKDMCMYRNIPDLIQAGVYSFKIEGRMRSADFVANIVSIYRRAIDSYVADPAGYHVNEEDWKNLFENRVRDYSTCFAMDKPDSRAIGYTGKREPRFFSYAAKEADLDCEWLNDLEAIKTADNKPKLAIKAATLAHAREALANGANILYVAGEVYRPHTPWILGDIKTILQEAHNVGAKVIVNTPRTTLKDQCSELEQLCHDLNEIKPDGIMVGNLGAATIVRELTDLPIYADHSFNLFNHVASEFLQ